MALYKKYANNAGANEVFQGPVFSEVLPFYKAWENLIPNYEEEARSIINPFVNRELQTQQRGITNQMAQTGGGRFASAYGQLGNASAQAERNRRAQMEDWLAQRRQGFKTLFYDPAEQAYNRAIELGKAPGEIGVPLTWQEMQFMQNGGTQEQMLKRREFAQALERVMNSSFRGKSLSKNPTKTYKIDPGNPTKAPSTQVPANTGTYKIDPGNPTKAPSTQVPANAGAYKIDPGNPTKAPRMLSGSVGQSAYNKWKNLLD